MLLEVKAPLFAELILFIYLFIM